MSHYASINSSSLLIPRESNLLRLFWIANIPASEAFTSELSLASQIPIPNCLQKPKSKCLSSKELPLLEDVSCLPSEKQPS